MSGQRSHAVAPSGPAGLALSAISPDVPDVWADIDDNDMRQENRYAHQLWGQIECSSSVPDSDSSNKALAGGGAHAGLEDLGIVTGGYDDDEGIGAVQHSAYKIPTAEQSSFHAAGQCSPCRFLFSKKGCQIGSECKYCHMPHEKPTKSRPSRDKRARCKKFADALDADPDMRVYTAEHLSAMGTYLQKIVDSKCRRGNTTAVKDKSTKASL